MIFPNNVHRKAADSKKLLLQDKKAIIIQLFFVANVVCFFLLRFLFNNFLGLSTGWALIAQLVLFIVIGIIIFRFVIFKEDEKIQEYKDQQSDSFARYLSVRKDNVEIANISERHVNMFTFTNGCVMATMLFKFGSNDDSIANSTRNVLESIYKTIGMFNFEYRTVTCTEKFQNSLEYRRHLAQINGISNKQLSLHLRTVTQLALQNAETLGNTDMLYLTVKSKIPGDKEQLQSLLASILKIIGDNVTCFRSFEFLNIDTLLEFYRSFYKIEAIDLAMMKAIELSADLDKDYSKIVSLYSLQSLDGKVYRVDSGNERQFSTKARDL